MQLRVLTTTVALFAVATLGTAAGTSPAAPPAPENVTQTGQQRTGPPVLVDCLWHPRVRPTNFMLACGDGNSRLASLHWTRWDARRARAEGVNWVNDCKPYCAAGHFHAYPVTVRLDRARPWKKHPQVSHYSRITLTYPAARPAQFGPTVSYPLWD
ncbi:hypothetical protein [Streptomyces griseorubiginosus]|uniref:Secreted protein n=1 Tax=Streptomyces griseorubiginosus TaxID=67304 RepID=A0AAI8KUK6_9ACTN|nr:hypothetical protein [Streptomyces griseorubiginosus]AYC36043.1 hypothetical protein DWG14_00251 [Streptomyces griseorubiginosus]